MGIWLISIVSLQISLILKILPDLNTAKIFNIFLHALLSKGMPVPLTGGSPRPFRALSQPHEASAHTRARARPHGAGPVVWIRQRMSVQRFISSICIIVSEAY